MFISLIFSFFSFLMDTKLEEILLKTSMVLAKIMGSIFSYFNHVMKSKSKHLQLLKSYSFLSLFSSLKKKCKIQKHNKKWINIFFWIDVCLNNCVFWPCTHNKPQNNFKKKLQNKKQVEIKASWNWMELGKNL